MHRIQDLQAAYFRVLYSTGQWAQCTDWAMERLESNEEGEDLEVVLLAASRTDNERKSLVAVILQRYLGEEALHPELAAGKIIADLHHQYRAGKQTIESLDSIFTKMYYTLGYPFWMYRLMPNCEYATDIPAYVAPFEEEFAYIAGLWDAATSLPAFMASYDPTISKSHDVPRA